MISNWGQLVSGSKLIIIGAAYPEQAETPEHRLYFYCFVFILAFLISSRFFFFLIPFF